MTLNEFKAWLDGYLAAGGSDVTVIKGKLDETHVYHQYIPPTFIPPYIPDTNPIPPYTVTCESPAHIGGTTQ